MDSLSLLVSSLLIIWATIKLWHIIAVHVQSPGVSAALVDLENLRAALSLDVLVDGVNSASAGKNASSLWLDADSNRADWRASSHPVMGWSDGSSATLSWLPPVSVGRPGVIRSYYLPENPTPRNVQFLPWLPILA